MISSATVKALTPTQSIFAVIGSLCNKPELLVDSSVKLNKYDFPKPFHKVVFFAINNLISDNGTIKELSAFDIDTYLQKFERYYKIWNDNKGIDYIQSAKDTVNLSLFDDNYHRVKKMTILRKYADEGFDISNIYDVMNVDPEKQAEQENKLNEMDEQDLISFFTRKALEIKSEVDDWVKDDKKHFEAGTNIMDLINRMQESPDVGYPFRSRLFNTMFGGMRPRKYLLRSAGPGIGKTRQALADLLYISCDKIYSLKRDDWVSLGVVEPTLFISTELEIDEIQKMLLSFITRLSPEVIKNGNYDSKTLSIITEGAKVLEKAPFYIVEMEDFNIEDIENEVDKYILNYKVKYIDFDYIQTVPKLSKEATDTFGSQQREDQILAELSRRLWQLANNRNVFIMSSTQLNGSALSDEPLMARTQQALRGSKAVADKIDYGIVMAKPSHKDLKNLNEIITDNDANKRVNVKPNMSYWCYKNRNGLSMVVVWTKIDLGTMLEIPLFVTDYNYELVDMKETRIILDDKGSYHVKENLSF